MGESKLLIKSCEIFSVATNSWAELPELNTARDTPGCILLESKRAFCFCGLKPTGICSNSIERLDTAKWKTLPLNHQIQKTLHLGAGLFLGEIVVFGGTSYTPSITYKFSEEGDLLADLSAQSDIPEEMRSGVFTIENGKIYVFNKKSDCALEVFDGKSWS